MNYEKAYKEALERAKSKIENDKGHVLYEDDIVAIFPELAESEDDKIVDVIRKALEAKIEDLGNGVTKTACINWLEKQCKQKINLVEILKHYPKETELYSPLYGKLWLAEVDEENEIITCYKHPLNKGCTRAILGQEDTISFYSDGTTGLPDFSVSKDCMLFLYDIEKQAALFGKENLDLIADYFMIKYEDIYKE